MRHLLAISSVFLLVLLFANCKTTKQFETIEIHDTLTIHKTDTVKDIRVVQTKDSTHHETERIITLMAGDSGRIDTVKQVINNTYIRYFERSDSTDKYRHIADSLKSILDKQKQKEVVKVKKTIDWELLGIVAFLAFACILLIKGAGKDNNS